MSKIGKAIIILPEGVNVSVNDDVVLVDGPKGKISVDIIDGFKVEINNKEVSVIPIKKTKQTMALWGTLRALINNAVIGVSVGYEKQLIIDGVGFKVALEGSNLVFQLGFSHPIVFLIPEGIEAVILKNNITIKGISKYLVGQVSAKIRALKKPEPYKGKGIRYSDEIIRRKVGKKDV